LPQIGAATEIIFIEGHSKDGTWAEITRIAEAYPERRIKVLKQKSRGKGGAVREAFEVATGDIVMILDAELTVPPEDLPKFFDALKHGRGEFVNGVRLVYPLEEHALQFLNMIANKLFGLTFSWLIGQPIKDTLCGTKALFRRDYQEIARNRGYFGEFDPFVIRAWRTGIPYSAPFHQYNGYAFRGISPNEERDSPGCANGPSGKNSKEAA
jgi:glycosyltransferase involved in cell wall biosynthesis